MDDYYLTCCTRCKAFFVRVQEKERERDRERENNHSKLIITGNKGARITPATAK